MADGVNLQDYVRETLRAIAQGVREAQADSEIGGYVGRAPLNRVAPFMDDNQGNTVMAVTFDVATTVEAKVSGGGGASVKVLSIAGVEGSAKREALRSAVSRVSFAVPMAVPKPPGQIADDEECRRRYG